MAECNKNLWAPWRMAYIRSLSEEAKDVGCFLCAYWQSPDLDRKNHVVWRGVSTYVVMNRFPYTNGHLLIVHAGHKADITDLTKDENNEMAGMIRDGVALLRRALCPQGMNIGYNLGQCAGAGVPGHLHAHIVPRWSGDTNFMAVLGDTRVVPDALDTLHGELVTHADGPRAAAIGCPNRAATVRKRLDRNDTDPLLETPRATTTSKPHAHRSKQTHRRLRHRPCPIGRT